MQKFECSMQNEELSDEDSREETEAIMMRKKLEIRVTLSAYASV